MKICLINRSYTNQIGDGISTYTHYLLQGLLEYGHEVHVITMFDGSNKLLPKNSGKFFIHQVKPVWSFKNFYLGKMAEVLYNLKVYFKFREIDKKYGIDIAEAPEAGAEGFWLAIFTRQKLITRLQTPIYLCNLLNQMKANWPRRLLYFMEKKQIKNSILLSSTSKSLARIMTERWGIKEDKIEVITHPISVNQFENYPKHREKDYLLYLGRIEKRKGVDVLFKALEVVLKNYPRLKIFLVGGVDRTYDKDRLKKLPPKINRNLNFMGEVEHSQVFSYIKGAKLIILPSLWETSSYTLLESLALGKIVIASNCGGFREIIKNNQNGFLFRTGSYQHLAQKIIECLRLDQREIKKIEKNARKTSLKYRSEEIIPKIIRFYWRANLLGKKNQK